MVLLLLAGENVARQALGMVLFLSWDEGGELWRQRHSAQIVPANLFPQSM